MIPSESSDFVASGEVYQRGLVIDSQLDGDEGAGGVSVSKGIGD